MFATWTFISIGRRVTQEWKFAFRLRGDSILLFKGQKNTLEIYDFQPSESYQSGIHSSSFFLFSTLAVPERLWQRRCHSLQQGSVVTPCPAVGPSALFLYTFCFFCGASTEVAIFSSVSMFHPFVEYQQQWFYSSKGFTPQTTSKMISLSQDILLVSKMIYHWWSYDSMCNVRIFRNVKEVLVKSVNTPPTPHSHPLMIIRQHVQRAHLP